jgi:MFS family permease
VSVFIGIDSPDEAGIYLVVPYVVGALSVPILGYFVEKVNKKSYLIILTTFFFFVTYFIMFYVETNENLREEEWIRWVPVTTMGLGIGLFCTVIIPTLPMIVNPKLLGTAFGLMEMMQNLALGIFPLLIGEIRETS